MALPALLSGADCGPSNPLQALSKQFERDRGIQQDHFGPVRAGPSKEVFRTESAPAPGLDQDAARFFSGQGPSSAAFVPQHVPNAFDLSALRSSLPQPQQRPLQSPSSFTWASDFLNHQSTQGFSPNPYLEMNKPHLSTPDANPIDMQQNAHLSPFNQSHFSGVFTPFAQHMPVFHKAPPLELAHQHLDAAAFAIHAQFPPEEKAARQLQQPQPPVQGPHDADELARTAGLLIQCVENETNPKFQNSAFLGLMRQLRDREMIVEGNDMVKAPATVPTGDNMVDLESSHNRSDVTINRRGEEGLAQAQSRMPFISSASGTVPSMLREVHRESFTQGTEGEMEPSRSAAPRKSVHFDSPEVLEPSSVVEDSDDAFWRQENEEYGEYWRAPHDRLNQNMFSTAPEWDKLQEDWDRFEATAAGIKPVSVYHFQRNNPYFLGESSTRNHAVHLQRLEWNQSVLEKEAAVQHDPRNVAAWFELGVKQQENEREPKAIQALRRAVELDPSYLPAWLALAISYTNENDKNGACEAIENWMWNNKRYEGSQLMHRLEMAGRTADDRHEGLIQCLLGLVRTMPEGEVDADIQTALGVLLNTDEEYEKAHDCFRTALAVRPNDWLLYNRVGATLANSGRASDALWYYHRALELNPSYIRARFNLGISCINMKNYSEAAEHILDALSLQENDTIESTDRRSITSSALWDCLRTTCLHLQRLDMTEYCDARDLDGFRKAFLDMKV